MWRERQAQSVWIFPVFQSFVAVGAAVPHSACAQRAVVQAGGMALVSMAPAARTAPVTIAIKGGGTRRAQRSARRAAARAAQEDRPRASSALSIFCPLLKLLGGGDPAAERNEFAETLTSGLASVSRLPFGVQAAQPVPEQPREMLVLYEFEACPFCRRVREAATDLDLQLLIKPCPKGVPGAPLGAHRAEVLALGGKETFPFLVDPNTGEAMYESEDIVRYLYDTYAPAGASVPEWIIKGTALSGWMPTLLRAGRGMSKYARARAQPPALELELYNYEGNQFARLVREALCELELPYICRSAGKGSETREQLRALSGATTVPYLVDPNTGKAMGESLDIVRYLFSEYSEEPQEP